ELLLQNASLTVGGAYTVTHDGVVNPNTIRILPGAFIPVARNTGHPQGPSIAPLERTGDFDLAAFVLQDMRVNIKRMLFDRSLPEQTGQPRTATEIIELLKEVQTEQAPAFARIMKEFIVPFAHRGFQIMHKKGQIQFPIEVDGQVIQIRVSSPLARAQHLDDLQNVVQGVEIVGGLFGPEVLASSLKVEEAPAYMYSKLGIDPALIRGEGDRQQIRNQIVERIAGMVAQAQGATGGNGASMGAAPAAGTA
ncbi:MAG: portal protein, partial [Alphaproteobacteria bacterium]|nr:portal protein [Alphaproteobacteria bacterium]